MASIRRTLSPVPRAGAMHNAEVHSVSSPLSKSSSCNQEYPVPGGSLSTSGSVDSYSVLFSLQAAFVGLVTRRYRHLERTKLKGQLWRRVFFHFLVCFLVGIVIGLTPSISMNVSMNHRSRHQAFSFEVLSPDGNTNLNDGTSKNDPLTEDQKLQEDSSLESRSVKQELLVGISNDPVQGKLLIIVTPTYTRPFQAYYLNRLAQTLRLVPSPLLWIVVEMFSQSAETADILRRTGVMYRHLACYKNITGVRDRRVHQRNVALSHIETHRLDGIVYFADDDNVYFINLFQQMRDIRHFGTWPVALLTSSNSKATLKGAVCNNSQVIGWHTDRRNGRFHSDISGFAFNSSIIWDQKRWHRSKIKPIRQLDSVNDEVQESMFIEQIVEDESQMEALGENCSRIMVWHLHLEAFHPSYPHGWFMKTNLDKVAPLQ